jgi:hypothetical protein
MLAKVTVSVPAEGRLMESVKDCVPCIHPIVSNITVLACAKLAGSAQALNPKIVVANNCLIFTDCPLAQMDLKMDVIWFKPRAV